MTEVRSESGQGDGIVGQAQEKVGEVASTAQEKAGELRQQGSSKLRDQLETRSTDAGRQARSLASSLRESSGGLRRDGNGTAAGFAEQLAERLEGVGGYLERKRGDELMGDVEDFARRRPWAFAGVGLLAGIAGARFMKASSERRYAGSRPTGYPYAGRPYGGTDAYPTRYSAGLSGPAAPYGERAVDAPLTREPVEYEG